MHIQGSWGGAREGQAPRTCICIYVYERLIYLPIFTEITTTSFFLQKNIVVIEEVKNIFWFIQIYPNLSKFIQIYPNLSKFITYVIYYNIRNYPKSPHHPPPPHHLSKSFFYIFEKSFREMLVVVDKMEILDK